MDSKTGRKTHLKKYLSHNGKWQFFPVVSAPNPHRLIATLVKKMDRGIGFLLPATPKCLRSLDIRYP